jgi:hypothetical protein
MAATRPASMHAWVKNNRQLARQSPLAEELGNTVLKRIGSLPELVGVTFPQRIAKPLFSAYEPGMEYGLHVDNGVMQTPHGAVRSDISMTIFLSPPESYDGGELLIEDSGLGHHRVKLPAGSAFAYPSTSLHRVGPVTRGVRLACVLWIQSQIRDPGQRPHPRRPRHRRRPAARARPEQPGAQARVGGVSQPAQALGRGLVAGRWASPAPTAAANRPSSPCCAASCMPTAAIWKSPPAG